MDSETTTLAKSEPQTQQGLITREALKVQVEQRELVKQFVREMMVEGSDFGTIPGTPKPTLLKPGAEKLTDLFRCTPKFALVKSDEDFDRGHGFFAYTFRVRLYQRDSNAVVAEGFGSANSREGRYRWREAQRKCPKCAKATIFHSKDGGWFCWKKKSGCGAEFEENAPAIVTQVSGKVENEDIATMANTILKMAKKRALVDGAIALARCSDLFTQDVEDLEHPAEPSPPPPEPKAKAPAEPKPAGKKAAPSQTSPRSSKPGPIIDVLPGESETDALARRLRAQRVWTAATKKGGMDEPKFKLWVSHCLGEVKPSGSWTDADLEKLEAGLPGVKLQPRPPEPPPNLDVPPELDDVPY